MPLSVRKSIQPTPAAAAQRLRALVRPAAGQRALLSSTLTIALSTALTICATAAAAQGGPKQETLQVKKLDDNNKEVLRPIPAVLKSKNESTATAKPLEKQKTAVTAAGKSGSGPASTGAAAKAEPAKQAASAGGKSQAASAEGKSQAASAEGKSQAASAEGKSQAASAGGKSQAASAGGQKEAAKAEATKPAGPAEKKTVARAKPSNKGMRFVPPPPPTTPTMLGDSSDFAFYNGMPIEMLSKDALKDRSKEISIQYKDACRELEDHSRQKDEKIQRAADFEGLYKEGVVSRRELEASQKDAAEVNSDIDRLTFKAKELKGLLDRINARLTQTVAKKRGHKLIN